LEKVSQISQFIHIYALKNRLFSKWTDANAEHSKCKYVELYFAVFRLLISSKEGFIYVFVFLRSVRVPQGL